MNLVCSFFNKEMYRNSNFEITKKRNNEYIKSLIENLNCKEIKKLHLFIDNEYSLNILKNITNEYENKDKIIIIIFNKQPTFSDFFKYIFKNIIDEPVMICNSDINLYKCDIKLIDHFIMNKNYVFCITRHESIKHKPLIDKRVFSHDAYIFKSPLNEDIIKDSNFFQNLKGSDNMMVFLFQKYNYITLNPCLQIIIIHNHKSDFREKNYKRINNKKYNKNYKFVVARYCSLDYKTDSIKYI